MRALADERRRRGDSFNATVIDLLRQALGLRPGRAYDNGLAVLAGTWSAEDHAAFEHATRCFEAVDEELWR